MFTQIAVPPVVTDQHLAPNDFAAYLDGATTGDRRARIEAHLAQCPECREEMRDAGRIIRTLPGAHRRARPIVAAVAAVAALVLISVLPRAYPNLSKPQHRESPVTTTTAPTAVAPLGAVDSVEAFVWSAVPSADRYHLRVYDANGSVIWERTVSDTTLPATDLHVEPGRAFYYQVQADVGFGRHVTSKFIEFSERRSQRQ
jgi:hypothetical protein